MYRLANNEWPRQSKYSNATVRQSIGSQTVVEGPPLTEIIAITPPAGEKDKKSLMALVKAEFFCYLLPKRIMALPAFEFCIMFRAFMHMSAMHFIRIWRVIKTLRNS